MVLTRTLHVCLKVYAKLKEQHDFGSKFKKHVKRKEGIEVMEGTSKSSAEGTTHSVRKEEQVAFSNWINRCARASHRHHQ